MSFVLFAIAHGRVITQSYTEVAQRFTEKKKEEKEREEIICSQGDISEKLKKLCKSLLFSVNLRSPLCISA